MAKKVRCEICERNFKNQEGLDMHNEAKHSVKAEEKSDRKNSKINYKRMKNWAIGLIIFGLIIWGISAMFSGVKVLPPTDMQGHVEASPSSHVLREPMPLAIQKHMLEHADGENIPGIIISYNCEDYSCEEGLIENLESFAEVYPENVYVAPFKNMAAKIALTKLGRIEVLEEYDENRIHIFISGRIPANEEAGISTPSGDGGESQIFGELAQETKNKEFDMIAKQWEFSPDTIRVNEGDSVILNVKSIDVAHGLAIPLYNINEFLSPGQTVKIEFVANKKGTFPFGCSVSCGAGHFGMVGKIIVE